MDYTSLLSLLEDLPRLIQYINLYNQYSEEPILLPTNCSLPKENAIATTCQINSINNLNISFSFIERPSLSPTPNKSKLIIKPRSYLRLLDNSIHFPYQSNQEFFPVCLVTNIRKYDPYSNEGIASLFIKDIYIRDSFSTVRKINTSQIGTLYSLSAEDCYVEY